MLITKKEIIVVLIIIIIILFLLSLYLLYNNNIYNDDDIIESFSFSAIGRALREAVAKIKTSTPQGPVIQASTVQNVSESGKKAVTLGLPGMAPWGQCNMGDGNSWINQPSGNMRKITYWIAGESNWITVEASSTINHFTKTITIVDKTKITSAIFYIIPDDECNVYLNRIIQTPRKLVYAGWGVGNKATALSISPTSFVDGINTFIFQLFNTGRGPTGLLANLVITYSENGVSSNGTLNDIYPTDDSWIYYGGTFPPNLAVPGWFTMPNNLLFANIPASSRSYSSFHSNLPNIYASSTLNSTGVSAAWSAGTLNNNEWMKLTLPSNNYLTVAGVAVKGRSGHYYNNSGTYCDQYVKSFYINYSDRNGNNKTVDNGKLFYTNLYPNMTPDGIQCSYIVFDTPISASVITIIPNTWNMYNSMRADLLLKQVPILNNISNNVYQLKSMNSNKCIMSNRDGKFNTETCSTDFNDEQHWIFIPININNNVFQIESMNSNESLYSDDTSLKTASSDPNSDKQKWLVIPIDIPNNIYQLQSIYSQKCIVSNADGRFNMFNCVAAYNDQHWKFIVPPKQVITTIPQVTIKPTTANDIIPVIVSSQIETNSNINKIQTIS